MHGAPISADKAIQRLIGLMIDFPQVLRAFRVNCPAHEDAVPDAHRRKPNTHRGSGKQCRQTFAHAIPSSMFLFLFQRKNTPPAEQGGRCRG